MYYVLRKLVFLSARQKSYRTPAIVAVLFVSDIIASVVIFTASFALGQSLVYLLILLLQFPGSVTASYELDPQAVVRVSESLGIDRSLKRDPASKVQATLNALTAFNPADSKTLNAVAVALHDEDMAKFSPSDQQLVRYSPELNCIDPTKNNSTLSYDFYSLYVNSFQRVTVLYLNTNKDFKLKAAVLDDAVRAELLNELRSNNDKCRIPEITINRNLDIKKWLGSVHPIDLYLGTSAITFSNVVSEILSKMGGYISFDPYNSMSDFLRVTTASSATSFLGLHQNQARANFSDYFSSYNSETKRYLHLPLSPLMGSSLISSAIFLAFIIWVLILAFTQVITRFVQKHRDKFLVENSPFTLIGIGVSSFCFLFMIFDGALKGFWSLLI